MTWTLLTVLVLAAGLSAWIIIPSVSGSLQNGLEVYANTTSTFIVVQSTAGPNPGNGDPLLGELAPRIAALPGVQTVYPIRVAYTWRLATIPFCLQNECLNTTGVTGINSAVIEGNDGFPLSLVDLAQGRIPQEKEAAFVLNAPQLKGIVSLIGPNQFKIGDSNWNSTLGVKFNATAAGVTALNPLTSAVQILWNSAFIERKLGPTLYNQTFGGIPNFMIIKADSIKDVESVANSVTTMLERDSNFFVNYDQATLSALRSLESQSLPLYALLQGISLAVTITVVFLVSYLISARRKWEPGLLLTQGWTWARYTRFVFSYYSILALVATALSIVLSLIAVSLLSYQYTVYGYLLTIGTTISPLYLISAVPLSLGLSLAAAFFSISTTKKSGLDAVLREY